MAAGKGSDFVAIAAAGHGAPAAAMRARGIIEEAAGRIGTNAKGRAGSFGDQLSRGTCDGRQEPIQTAFAGDKLQAPCAVLLEEFVVPFGDTQDFVDGLNPFTGNGFLAEQRAKACVQGSVEALGFAEKCSCALRIDLRESEQLSAALRGDDAGKQEKAE
jgi:hypothetical protein